MIRLLISKLLIVMLIMGLCSCEKAELADRVSYLSKDEVWQIASHEIIRKSKSKLELSKDEWEIRLDAKWIIDPKTADISYGGGISINVDPIKGHISDFFHGKYVSDKNKELSEDEIWQIAYDIINKREPGIELLRDEWIIFKEIKWIVSPKIPDGAFGGGTTLDIDPSTGKILDYYFTE